MNQATSITLSTSPPSLPAGKPRLTARRRRSLYGRTRQYFTGKGQDAETGLYYYGARYLDPRAARWAGGDPALGEYVPGPGRGPGGLPGMGGVYNTVNLHVYHYAGNNPVKYTDPDGRMPKHASVANAFNIDFGRDYMDLASANFREGEYGWAAMMVLDATSEAAYNLLGAYGAASLFSTAGAFISTNIVPLANTAKGALERGVNKVRSTFEGLKNMGNSQKLLEPPSMAKHHIFPQQFKKIFDKAGIDIDKYTISIPQNITHLKGLHGRGINGMPGHWNQKWADFFRTNPNATNKDMYQFAGKLIDEFRLNNLPIDSY